MKASPSARWVISAALLGLSAGCDERAAQAMDLDLAPRPTLGAGGRAAVLDFGVTPTLADTGPVKAIAVADVDRDGHPDLVTVDPSAGVAVRLGTGDGGFGAPRLVLDGSRGPRAIVAADLDGDGRIDLAVAFATHVRVMLGRGDGSFDDVSGSPVIESVSAITAGDFDGDGRIDLAIASAAGSVSVMRGQGRRELADPVEYPSIGGITALFAADFDGDGRQDLLAISTSQSVTLFNAGTELRAGPITTTGSGPHRTAVAVADVNHDGRADIAASFHEQEDEWLTVDLGRGPVEAMTFPYWQRPSAMAAGDLDGDGKADLLVGMSRGKAVLALLGNGDGTFRKGQYSGLAAVPSALAVSDLDGDGKLDVVAVAGGISVLLGRGDGTFRGERAFLVSRDSKQVVVGDLNGDGEPDCVVTDADYLDRFAVYLGDGNGGFGEASGTYDLVDAGARLALADLNRDGKLDVVSADDSVVLLGKGDGTFEPHREWSSTVAAHDLVLGDFNSDGAIDLVLIVPGSREAPLLLGKGDGSFEPARTVALDGALAGAAASDLDGDGALDLVVSTDAGLDLIFGHGNGTFETARHVITGKSLSALAVGDFSGDGRPDLAVAPRSGDDVSVLLNLGERAFAPPTRVAVGGATTRLTTIDLDGDGVLDLVAQGSSLRFLVGHGDGTFQPPRGFGFDGRDVDIVDVDHDGLPDLLVVQRNDRFLRRYLNTSIRPR